jgi:flagellar assembly protein FliH
MGLLKAADAEYLLLDDELPNTGLALQYQEEGPPEYEMSGPMIIGGSGLLTLEDLDLSQYTDNDGVFFTAATTEVTLGDTITIGGARAPVEETYDFDNEYTENDEYQDSPDYEEDAYNYEEEVIEEDPNAEPASIKDFSNLSSMGSEGDEEAAAAWADGQRTSMMTRLDDKVRQMMNEQGSAFKQQSKEQLSFVSAEEKNRLVAEAMDTLRHSPQSESLDFEKIFQDIADYIENLAWHHTEKIHEDMEGEREQSLATIEEYVENSINEQREQMMMEAQEYISKTVQEYKQSLTDDNEYIKAANQIIADRENILNEAYEKSLLMVQEAETEHGRIMEDAMLQQQQAEQTLQEAEAQVELMAQEAQAEAERILSEANMEAARIIEAAEQSHQEIVEAATQDGFNVGYQEGREEAIKENAQLLMETTNALNKLHAAFPVAVKQNEDKLIKLALEISREIIQDELAMKPEIVLKNVERAIGKVSDLEKVLIKVNPLDLDMILPKQEYFKKLLPDVQDFVITGHYSIERGGCTIETNSGTIDAQVNTQLAVVEEVFQQIRSEYDFDEDDDMNEEDEI